MPVSRRRSYLRSSSPAYVGEAHVRKIRGSVQLRGRPVRPYLAANCVGGALRDYEKCVVLYMWGLY